jgi:hypothetical protein
MQSDSDAALDNAKQEVLFRYRELVELEPDERALQNRKPADLTKDNLVQNAFYVMEKVDFDNRHRDILSKTMMAQVKYILLLEQRIGK